MHKHCFSSHSYYTVVLFFVLWGGAFFVYLFTEVPAVEEMSKESSLACSYIPFMIWFYAKTFYYLAQCLAFSSKLRTSIFTVSHPFGLRYDNWEKKSAIFTHTVKTLVAIPAVCFAVVRETWFSVQLQRCEDSWTWITSSFRAGDPRGTHISKDWLWHV